MCTLIPAESVPAVVVIFVGTAVVIIALCVFFIKRKGRRTISKSKMERVGSDGGDEDDDETDGVKGAAPPPISKEQEQEPRLRKRISTTK